MHQPEQLIATAVLVVGTGGAGLRAAIELAEAGVDVLAVGKRPRADAHTVLAAGGINAALATVDPQDSWQQHAADTLQEGYLLGDPRTVTIVAKGAARAIEDLERYGMPFAREADGRISQRFFGAHTFRRTAFAGDYTGLEIQRVLVHRAEALGLPILDTAYITKLLVRDNVVFGAYGFDLRDGTRYVIRADAVILAAGGHTRIWRRTSSRRDENTGDSFRLAVEAGARIRDPELVQFHPSGLIEPEQVAGTLVSEAARGEGGILATASASASWRVTTRSAWSCPPATASRSPRTPRSRRVAGHPTAGSGSTSRTSRTRRSCVACRASIRRCSSCRCSTSRRRHRGRAHRALLDGRHLGAPGGRCDGCRGLYAIGEASSGLHGANRLGGNSLVELLVYGRIAGRAAAAHAAALAVQRRSPAAVAAAGGGRRPARRAGARERALAAAPAARCDDRRCRRRARRGRSEAGLDELDAIEERLPAVAVHPDSAGFQDLAHAFDLRSSPSPPERPSRLRWSDVRPADATTVPTIPTSIPPCRSTSCGAAGADSSASRSRRSRMRSRRSCTTSRRPASSSSSRRQPGGAARPASASAREALCAR